MTWQHGLVTLAHLVAASGAVAAERSRLRKVGRLADLLAALDPAEVPIGVAFLSGRARQGALGVGGTLVRAARDVVPAAAPALTLAEVDAALGALADARGAGSARGKAETLRALFARATEPEQDFLVRLLFGELRQGALEGVLLDAVAKAAGVPAPAVRRATMLAGDLGVVAAAALAGGEAALVQFSLQLMRPVQPMLAGSAEDVTAALAGIERPTLELKLDGARVQVHRAGDEVRVFSRQLNDVTAAVPEVVEAVRAMPARDLVLDGEAIVLRTDGSPEPFQVTMRRFGRRRDVERLRRELPLAPFFFDVLHLDGQTLLDEPQQRRFGLLAAVAPEATVVPHETAPTPERAAAFYDEAVRRGHEGVMAKDPASPYAAGSRGSAWLKVKAAHTLDLVVLAAEWGSGRRHGRLSNLHLGARDPDRNAFVMLGKTFKGLTDEMLEWQTREFLAREIARDAYTVHVRPELVVEVAFSDVQQSPRYPGGVALRLARVKRYRPDKAAGEADTIATVVGLLPRRP
jgi:DNA ligase-1